MRVDKSFYMFVTFVNVLILSIFSGIEKCGTNKCRLESNVPLESGQSFQTDKGLRLENCPRISSM